MSNESRQRSRVLCKRSKELNLSALKVINKLFQQSCTNMNKCHCNFGWMGLDCSGESTVTSTTPATVIITQDPSIKMERKETPYGKRDTPYFKAFLKVLSYMTMVTLLANIFFYEIECFAINVQLKNYLQNRKIKINSAPSQW